MLMNRYHIRRLLWMALLTGSIAVAGSPTYLGLTLNVDSTSVEKLLKSRGSVYDTNYGYKGYSKDLPVFKITSDPIMGKHGQINEAWLQFTPAPHRLYLISATWADSGSTFNLLKDVLDQKYVRSGTEGRGFVKRYLYQDGDVAIRLTRNSFGFGKDQSTTLEYIYQPAVPDVENMKAKIDQTIKKKKLKSSGADL